MHWVCELGLWQSSQFSGASIFSPGLPFPFSLPLGIKVLSLQEVCLSSPNLLSWKNSLCRSMNQPCYQQSWGFCPHELLKANTSATCFLRSVFPQVLNIPGIEQHCLLLWGPGSNWICLQWFTFPSFEKDSLKFLFNLSSFYQRFLSSFMALLAESVCLFNLSFAFWLGFFLKYYCRFCRMRPIIVKVLESVRLPLTIVCIVLVHPDHHHLQGG